MNSAPTASSPTLRERILGALEHFWCSLRVDHELHPYLEGTWSQPVTAATLAGLLAAERQAFDWAVLGRCGSAFDSDRRAWRTGLRSGMQALIKSRR
jgi:hypothetical protein